MREAGRQRLYRLNGRALKPIHDWVKGYESRGRSASTLLDDVLDELKEKEEGDGSGDSGTAVVTLPTDTEILITREFDAPPQLV